MEMGLFDRLRDALHGTGDTDELAGYRRLGEQVYEVEVELAKSDSARAKAYLRAAKGLQVMGDALLRDVLSKDARDRHATVPDVTARQAEAWYGMIPELLVAARQEAAYSGSARLDLPISLDAADDGPHRRFCPASHLAGMRRAADEMEGLLADKVRYAREAGEKYRDAIIAFEEARTRRASADAVVGSLMDGRRVPEAQHEEAEEQYALSLSIYLLLMQVLEDPSLLSDPHFLAHRPCKLDSDDVWRLTSQMAKDEIRAAGEWWQAEQDIHQFWMMHRITPLERAYEVAVEDLVKAGKVHEEGYWFACPFESVYRVVDGPVRVLSETIPNDYMFFYDYSSGHSARLIVQSSLERTQGRDYGVD